MVKNAKTMRLNGEKMWKDVKRQKNWKIRPKLGSNIPEALGFRERNEAQVRVKLRLSEKAKALMKQPVPGAWTKIRANLSGGAFFFRRDFPCVSMSDKWSWEHHFQT